MLNAQSRGEVAYLWAKWNEIKGPVEAYEWFRPKGECKLRPRFVWKDLVPPKYSFTTWQAIKDRLATRGMIAIKWMTKERVTAVIRKARRLTLMTTVSLTWRARNALVHDGTAFELRHVVFEVKKIACATLYSIYQHETMQKYLGV
ncbi:hypothetical protein AAHA92_17871 [Salvia divinorum]|uniref:Reverse transcriptase zinc-binding domain-containing protein n=1 Tax=Salvia divinorum TaxID=28513 RepID=A0ABD1H325_SALDI